MFFLFKKVRKRLQTITRLQNTVVNNLIALSELQDSGKKKKIQTSIYRLPRAPIYLKSEIIKKKTLYPLGSL